MKRTYFCTKDKLRFYDKVYRYIFYPLILETSKLFICIDWLILFVSFLSPFIIQGPLSSSKSALKEKRLPVQGFNFKTEIKLPKSDA